MKRERLLGALRAAKEKNQALHPLLRREQKNERRE